MQVILDTAIRLKIAKVHEGKLIAILSKRNNQSRRLNRFFFRSLSNFRCKNRRRRKRRNKIVGISFDADVLTLHPTYHFRRLHYALKMFCWCTFKSISRLFLAYLVFNIKNPHRFVYLRIVFVIWIFYFSYFVISVTQAKMDLFHPVRLIIV